MAFDHLHRKHLKRPVRFGLLPHSGASFLVTLIVLFVSAPIVEKLAFWRVLDALLVTAVLCAAAIAVGGGRRTLAATAALALPAVVTRWISTVWPESLPVEIPLAAFPIFVAFVVVLFLRFILRAPRVNSEVLCTAVSTYLLLGLLWASAYVMVDRLAPGSFAGLPQGQPLQGTNALYFSLVTLTTVGYGDIAALTSPARMLAAAEAVTGSMYVAVLVARLVSVYTVEAAREDGE